MSLDISQHIQVRIEPAATCEKPCPGGGGIFKIWCHHSWYIGVYSLCTGTGQRIILKKQPIHNFINTSHSPNTYMYL